MTEEQRNIAELFVAEESIALYRLPFSDEFTVVVQDRRKATSETDGFVMMPFAESEAHPTVVISPDRIVNCKFRVEDNLYHTEKEIENVVLPDDSVHAGRLGGVRLVARGGLRQGVRHEHPLPLP